MERDPEILALILGGSLAHGFAREDSDVDILILVSPEVLERHRSTGRLHYNNRSLCTYPGYIDGKFLDAGFLYRVAERGSDAARYAFKDARILFSRLDGLNDLLCAAARYPIAHQADRVTRFGAQLLAWRWYYSEAVRQQSPYLACLAVQRVVLFSTRLVLTLNAALFPYHKWMLRVLESVPHRPSDMIARIDQLLQPQRPAWETVDRYCRDMLAFAGIDFDKADSCWPTHFMRDTELRWMNEEPAIEDL